MRAIFRRRPRRSILTGMLAFLLFCSPAAALRMLITQRLVKIVRVDGSWVGLKLTLHRKSPPMPIEVQRPLAIRKADGLRPLLPFDRGERGVLHRHENSASARVRPADAGLKHPAYLRIFLPSSPQNPVYPPSDPVPLPA